MRGSIFLAASLLLAACEEPSILLTATRARVGDPNPFLAICDDAGGCSSTVGATDRTFPEGDTSRVFGLFGGVGVVKILFRIGGPNDAGDCIPVDVDGARVVLDVEIQADGHIVTTCAPSAACAETTTCQ